MHDVFISYSSMDFAEAEYVRKNLEELYIPCWMAPRDIPTGANYADIIPSAIKNARFFLILVSKNSMDSDQVKNELNLAVGYKRVIISYRLDNGPLSDAFKYHLGTKQWIDAQNRQTQAIRETVDYIYECIKKMPKMDESPEDEKANSDPDEIKRMFVRVGLTVIIVIAALIANIMLYHEYASTGTFAGKSLILDLIIFMLVILIMAPAFGGKRNMLLHFIDVIREIVMNDTQNSNKERK